MTRLHKYLKEQDILKYLEGRDIILDDPRFPVYTDTEEDIAYFPLFNLSGKFVGYQRLNPKGLKWSGHDAKTKIKVSGNKDKKYYTYVSKEDPEKKVKSIALYGLHTIDKRNYFFVVEGIFDAVKLIRLNEPVVAVLANHPRHLRSFFFAMQKTTIAILDRDDGGNKLSRVTDKNVVVPEPYNDLGDMPLKEVEVFIRKIKK